MTTPPVTHNHHASIIPEEQTRLLAAADAQPGLRGQRDYVLFRLWLDTDQYNQRAGIEGTISQAVRVADIHYARYVGLAKTHLQHLATAAGINLARITTWLMEVPKAQTRSSRFMKLKPSFLT